ncbi:PD-(D/E)XK motif protein [Horticoccus luteus]|uniref:PD-(D/E)XK motif protein n=1 Tax=Horticoccus luteus TaxID=2862869 RepID=A0A8F9XL84_9BACT|nr:PD-(D/E)XK motif protein [Horticoccus luteus]QYM78956.1 PD-(D/E)XK motif protein [Horticoccus luteus]
MSEPLTIGFSALWKELEASAGADASRWWLIRCRPTPGRSLFAAREAGTGRRAVLLPLDGAQQPARRQWPEFSALAPACVVIDGVPHIGATLTEPRFADVFDALAVDLAWRVEEAPTASAAVIVLLGQLRRWQRFLASARDGLDPAAQRGLWGELHFLHTRLLPLVGGAAVTGWKGPEGAHQDFQFPSAWIEVKTTLAKQPQSVRIASERQLDDTLAPALFLHVLALEAHEGGAATLPAEVAAVRASLSAWPEARENFEDALLAAGYLDQHSPRYGSVGYAVRQTQDYRVAPGFPRIVETGLPNGVGEVGYALSLAACTDFAIPPDALAAALVHPA